MDQDYSWKSLFKPGEAVNYFDLPNASPIQISNNGFSLSNAWWLAEISRLIYHSDFFNENDINLGNFDYDVIGYIDNQQTSTQVAILKVNSATPCLVIVFRGTDDLDDWHTNIHTFQTSFNNNGKVHYGFKKAYMSIRKELFKYLQNNSLPIFITGHSLGAALATLAAAELAHDENYDSCYTFGSPRTGSPAFVNSLNSNKIFRVVNNCDVVTTVPLNFLFIKYRHIGLPYLINDQGELLSDMSNDNIYAYQKDKLHGLKKYAKSKFFSKRISAIKDDLPAFLADHAPLNYVIRLRNLIIN